MITISKRIRCKIANTIYDHVSEADLPKLPGFSPAAFISFDDTDEGWQAAFMVFNFAQKKLDWRPKTGIALDPTLQNALNNVLGATQPELKAEHGYRSPQYPQPQISQQPKSLHYVSKRRLEIPSFKNLVFSLLVIGIVSAPLGFILAKGGVIATMVASFLTARVSAPTQRVFHKKKQVAPPHVALPAPAPKKEVTPVLKVSPKPKAKAPVKKPNNPLHPKKTHHRALKHPVSPLNS